MPEPDGKPDDKKKEKDKANLEQRMTNSQIEKYALAGGGLTALPAVAAYLGNPYVQSLGYTASSALYMPAYVPFLALPLVVGAIVGGFVYYGIKKLLGYSHVKREKKDEKEKEKKEPAAPGLPQGLPPELQGMMPATAPP